TRSKPRSPLNNRSTVAFQAFGQRLSSRAAGRVAMLHFELRLDLAPVADDHDRDAFGMDVRGERFLELGRGERANRLGEALEVVERQVEQEQIGERVGG